LSKQHSRLLPLALVMAFLVAGVIPAMADQVYYVPPEAQPYVVNPAAPGVGLLMAFIETPSGATFANNGFADLDPGWTAFVMNPTYAVEYGPLSTYLSESLDITGNSPVTVNVYAFTGCVVAEPFTGCPVGGLTDLYQLHFDVSGGSYNSWSNIPASSLDGENTSTPEPTTLLMVLCGALLTFGLRRKFTHRQQSTSS
jgi:PEP-CTERM motif